MRCIPISGQWPYFYQIQLHAVATIAFEHNYNLRIGGEHHRYERQCACILRECMCTFTLTDLLPSGTHLFTASPPLPIRLIIAAIVTVTVETNCLQSTASWVSIPKLFRDLHLCSCFHSTIFSMCIYIYSCYLYISACIYGFTFFFLLRLRVLCVDSLAFSNRVAPAAASAATGCVGNRSSSSSTIQQPPSKTIDQRPSAIGGRPSVRWSERSRVIAMRATATWITEHASCVRCQLPVLSLSEPRLPLAFHLPPLLLYFTAHHLPSAVAHSSHSPSRGCCFIIP